MIERLEKRGSSQITLTWMGLMAWALLTVTACDSSGAAPTPPSSPPPAGSSPPPPIVAEANAFYVSPTGSDSAAGTLAAPFRTLQHCAEVVTAGQACIARAGTYRETVIPAQSGSASAPITFKVAPGETALMNGADIVTGFTADTGGRFKAPIAWDLGAGQNQVFLNGKMLIEARYPNLGSDVAGGLFDLGGLGKFISPRGAGTAWTIDAPGLGNVNLAGANINLLPGPAWVMESGTVTASGAGTLSFDSPKGQMKERPSFFPDLYKPRDGNPYFVWGKLELLDAANEWFYGSGALYLGQNPGSGTIEVKRRRYAFDLSGRSYVTVQGFQVFAATITTGDPARASQASSSHITLDGVHLRYPSHFSFIDPANAWNEGLETGVMLFGQSHTLKNSSIAYSAGNGVVMGGQGHTLENNVIHHTDYAMTDAGAVYTGLYGTDSSGHRVNGNTMYDTGRSVIVHRYTKATGITHNLLYNGGLLTNDLGMTYTFQSDGGDSEIAYNVVHDNFAPSESMGVYLDNGSRNYVVHHNLVYNVRNALNLNLPSLNNKVYNNTLLGWNESVGGGAAVVTDCDATGTELINNIFSAGLNFGGVFDGTRCPAGSGLPGVTQNLGAAVNPGFSDLAGEDFSLQAGSSAIDTGRVVAPYTDGFRGAAPDQGALESGLAPFKAGVSLNVPCVYSDACTPVAMRRYGLIGQYFSDESLTTLAWTRVDPNLDLGYWSETAAPAGTFMPSGTHYSARWTGFITAPVTGSYSFTVTADDGARLWIGGQALVNRWDYKSPPEDTATINLQAGQRYVVKLEMHQGSGGATAKLEWAYPGQPRTAVPRRAFAPE